MEDARPRRVALIKGACNYDHLRCFIDAMKMAFEDEGCVAVEVDLAKGADAGGTHRRVYFFPGHPGVAQRVVEHGAVSQ